MVNLNLLDKRTHQGGKKWMGGREGDYVMTPGVDNPFYHHLGKVI